MLSNCAFLIILLYSVSAVKFKWPKFNLEQVPEYTVTTAYVPATSYVPATTAAIERSQIRDLKKYGIIEEFGPVKYRIKASMKEHAPGDGNCLFHSVVKAIASQKKNHPKEYRDLPTLSANDLRQAGVDYLSHFYQKQATEEEKVQMDREVRNTHFADVQSGWGSFLASKEMNFIIPSKLRQQYEKEVISLRKAGYGRRKAREMFISEVGEPVSNVVSYCKYMSLRPGCDEYFAVRLNQAKRYHPEEPWHLPVYCESVERCGVPIWGDTFMIKALASMLKREIIVILKVERTSFFAMRYEPEWGVDEQDKTLYPLVITMDASSDFGGIHYNPMDATIRLATDDEKEDARQPETLPAPTSGVTSIFGGKKKGSSSSSSSSEAVEEDSNQEESGEKESGSGSKESDSKDLNEPQDIPAVDASSLGCFGFLRKNKKKNVTCYV